MMNLVVRIDPLGAFKGALSPPLYYSSITEDNVMGLRLHSLKNTWDNERFRLSLDLAER